MVIHMAYVCKWHRLGETLQTMPEGVHKQENRQMDKT